MCSVPPCSSATAKHLPLLRRFAALVRPRPSVRPVRPSLDHELCRTHAIHTGRSSETTPVLSGQFREDIGESRDIWRRGPADIIYDLRDRGAERRRYERATTDDEDW